MDIITVAEKGKEEIISVISGSHARTELQRPGYLRIWNSLL